MTLILNKKRAASLQSAAQVYGRQALEKATEIGLFKNAACTMMHVVVDLFTTSHDSPWNNRAPKQFTGSCGPWVQLGRGAVCKF